ncbi:hypothetical protein [Rhodohalobacter sp.]|uniref:hypothetical protein n=1 Tax=Rhodohalobacter sp. TaxID=1974210 RepID=UPI002ACDA795|nr:hypothetical protein [Rhodohalobacter sp.]MDZ7757758.1 hypothetical protein [Rhodohalobacter sp.]
MKQVIDQISKKRRYSTQFCSNVSTLFMGLMLFACISCGVTDNNDPEIDDPTDLELAAMSFEELMEDPNNSTILFPDEDPGIPIYARVGPILNQFFVTDGHLVIPFYRDPECIRDDFNFLSYYDPPVAFGCELTVEGKFVIESDAEQGTFPIMAHTEGTQVPVWIVDWAGFQALLETESVTIPDIEALNPIKGVAQQYEEYLSPRMNEHEVIIEAEGTIPGTDQQFTFSLTHRGDQIERISLDIQ